MKKFEVIGLETIPEVKPGNDISELINDSLSKEKITVTPGDIIVVSSKILSKAEGRIVDLNYVEPSKKARAISKLTGKSAPRVQVILEETEKIIGYLPFYKLMKHDEFVKSYFGGKGSKYLKDNRAKDNESVLFTVMPGGQLMTDGGTDLSNVRGKSVLSLLPQAPMSSAEQLRTNLEKAYNCSIGVVISDSEIRALRQGTSDIAIGYSGIIPVSRGFGQKDLYGEPTFGGVDSIVDQVANSAALIMGQRDENIPVVVIKGLENYLHKKRDFDSQPDLPYSLMAYFIKEVSLSRFKLLLWRLISILE